MKSFIFRQLITNFYKLFFSINLKPEKLNINKDSKCLILTTHIEEALFGCGGMLIQNKNIFDIKCLTNGFKNIIDKDLSYEEKVNLRRKEFDNIVEKLGINDARFFNDVDDNRLLMRYDRFKAVDLANYDYIFIPNILENNRDNKAISILLNQLLSEENHKKNLKIIMYELNSALALPNVFVDISDSIDEKTNLLNMCKTQTINENYSDIVKGLNRFRGSNIHKEFAEAYCMLDAADFIKICKLYSL